MESSIAVFLLRQFAYEQLPTWDMQCARPCLGWELIMHGARLCVAPCCVDVLCDHLSGAWRVEASGLVAPPQPHAAGAHFPVYGSAAVLARGGPRLAGCFCSPVGRREACKLKVWGSIPSAGSRCGVRVGVGIPTA